MSKTYHPSTRTSSIPQWYGGSPKIETALLTRTYLGFVRDTRDPQKMGRILVWIPEISGDPNKPENWVLCSYCSPFAGASFQDTGAYTTDDEAITEVRETSTHRTPNKTEGVRSGRQSYGMWFVPPDVGNEVIIQFINGDPNQAIWIGCLFQQDMNHMMPGIAENNIVGTTVAESGPVLEADLQIDPSATPGRIPFNPLRNGLKQQQGLDQDIVRGQSSSSAKRETPSQVFGILTPNANQFVMDDSEDNTFIRLRTKSGAQILVNETEGFIYAVSRDGKTWIELSNEGNIDVYGEANVSFHAEKIDVNLKAGQDINMQAGRNINIQAGGSININSGSLLNLKSGSSLAITSGAEMGITGNGGDIRIEAPNIWHNSGPGPQAIAPATHSPSGPSIQANSSSAWVSGAAYPQGSNIIPIVPQHEPWSEHTIQNRGTNNRVIETVEPVGKQGSTSESATEPNNIVEPTGALQTGTGYDANNTAQFQQTGTARPGTIIPINQLQMSQVGLDLIKQYEGMHLTTYQDIAGNDTIGIGHLITDEEKASGRFSSGNITEAEAEALLLEDLAIAQKSVRGSITQPLTQDQYDSMTSLAFNIGGTNFSNSTLVTKINEGNFVDVPNQMARWNKATIDGKLVPVRGLSNRRTAEAELFSRFPSTS